MSSGSESPGSWWAPGVGSGFRQRCAAALTHPATVAALATLLLNDILFKSLWPHAWVTGKLSDLAWVVFALPLLAFLLSLLSRGNVTASRVAFLTAYAGLPLLYAAFNTFEPVHYWILTGIGVVSGGTPTTPLDATDSLVIPLGWVLAVWVWQRPAFGTDALRLRFGLLVAGVAVLASVASSIEPMDFGIYEVGVSEDGQVYATSYMAGSNYSYPERILREGGPIYTSIYRSGDGGLNWTSESSDEAEVMVQGGDSTDTPRGTYAVQGTDIVLTGKDGRSRRVYSTGHLLKAGNVYAQTHATSDRYRRKLATRPLAIVYDEHSGNLIAAMGLQGVLVGTPDGRWMPHAVGPYRPTDFSMYNKTLILLNDLHFWIVMLVLSLSMTGAGLLFSLDESEEEGFLLDSLMGASLMAVAIMLPGIALFVAAFLVPSLIDEPLGNLLLIALIAIVLLAPIVLGIASGFNPRTKTIRRKLRRGIALLSMLASAAALLQFGSPDTSYDGSLDLGSIWEVALVVLALDLGIAFVAVSWSLLRYWQTVIASLVGMNVLVFLAFMPWLHLGIPLFLSKAAALALTGLAAFLLVGLLARKS